MTFRNAILPLAVSLVCCSPVLGADKAAPLDVLKRYEDAMNHRDLSALAALYADDLESVYVDGPKANPVGKEQELRSQERLFTAEGLRSLSLKLSGDIHAISEGPGEFRIDGIESSFSVSLQKPGNDEPQTYTVQNWATWFVRAVGDGFQIYRAQYWTEDPAE